MRRVAALSMFVCCVLGAACGRQDLPTVEINDVRIFAPLPGTTMSVAYMSITNNSSDELLIVAAASPHFGRAEFHESRIEDGIAKMRSIEHLAVNPESTVTLAEGGTHLMLMQPSEQVATGQPVTLRLRSADGSEFILDSVLRSRTTLARDEAPH